MSAQGLLRSLRATTRTGGPRRRTGNASRSRPAGRLRLRPRAMLAIALCAALLFGGWVWLRDSSLVAVERVTVTGVRGPDAGQIRAALIATARGMTTLHVRLAPLRAAVSAFPNVADIHVYSQFPHGLRIVVSERTAVAKAVVAGQTLALAADGTVLRDAATDGLPAITLSAPAAGPRVSDPGALAELAVLASAPRRLLGRIAQVTVGYWHGAVVQLRNGPRIYFGDGTRPEAKWRAALALLATPQVAGADYVDVSDPERAAAGLDSPPASLTSQGTTTGSSSGIPSG